MLLSSWEVRNAEATTITITREISVLPQDGCLYCTSSSYETARNTTSGFQYGYVLLNIGGQKQVSGNYTVYRAFLSFDTSNIPYGANITTAILSVNIWANDSTDDFNLTIQNGMPTYPHNPLETTDYYCGHYSGDGGSRNTSSIISLGYWNITLNTNGYSWIREAGITKFCLRSNKDISNVAPTQSEYLIINTYEAGEAYSPKLYVTYEARGCHYIVHGPYYEDGSVASAVVNATVYQPYNESFTLTFNGSGGADTFDFYMDQPPTYMSWPASPTLNYTRIYYFLNSTFDEVWLFICKSTTPSYPYQFTITDFYGMQNPYMETIINVAGQERVVERKRLNVANTISFIMVQWTPYQLRFRCNQGVYTQSFSAENTFTTNIPILSGSFPTTTYTYPTVTATRTSPLVIAIAYVDPTLSTVWIRFQIYHYIGETGVLDYALNATGNTYSFSWTDADNGTDYYVYSQAYADGKVWQWLLPTPASVYGVNPWTDIIVPSLGTLPLINVDFSQVIASSIILCVLGIFSYASAGVGCILSWLTAGIFILMGWFVMSVPMFTFAGFVSILVMIDEAKRTEREI